MSERVEKAGLQVNAELANFIEEEALNGLHVEAEAFWQGFADLLADLAPRNAALLTEREELQGKIDAWHRANPGQVTDQSAYRQFLTEIGYLVPEGADFAVDTANVDAEIAATPGPQLVVPITNARFALNAANARWGSLYDALYGTDALGDTPSGGGYDAERGARVIAWAKAHLDAAVPLASGSWADVTELSVTGGAFLPSLADPAQFAGRSAHDGKTRFLFRKNGLGIDVVVDPASQIGASDPAAAARALRGLLEPE